MDADERDRVSKMTVLEAEDEITKAVTEAAALFVKLESVGKIHGNAQHFIQSLASQARILLRNQWN